MRLFLVRHGETVDNVAGIYAGIRDSPLTAHGVLQARRLAAHLVARSNAIGSVRHVFASDLRRAVDTATAVVDAQAAARRVDDQTTLPPTAAVEDKGKGNVNGAEADVDADVDAGALQARKPKLIQLPELRERDFGSAEGKKFGVGLVLADAETREQMRLRAERFVQAHLVPLLAEPEAAAGCVVVVAHGLILDSLLRVLLARFGPGEMARWLGSRATTGWSNTGYVELVVGVGPVKSAATDDSAVEMGRAEVSETAPISTSSPPPPWQQQRQPQITMSVVGVNVLKHLEGLKKTRGGIGSTQFDKRQRTMDSFFGPAAKKSKVERESEGT